jgi:glycerol-3-phosphate acyltransferase PlsY
LIAVALFLALAAAFRWIALASIVASASLPLLAYWLGEANQAGRTTAGGPLGHAGPVFLLAAGALMIVAKHHANIRRMLAGNEPRFQTAKK